MYLLHQDIGNMFLRWVDVPYSDQWGAILFRASVMPTLMILAGAAVYFAVEKPSIPKFALPLQPGFWMGRISGSCGKPSASSSGAPAL
jgi:hypothetical protein